MAQASDAHDARMARFSAMVRSWVVEYFGGVSEGVAWVKQRVKVEVVYSVAHVLSPYDSGWLGEATLFG